MRHYKATLGDILVLGRSISRPLTHAMLCTADLVDAEGRQISRYVSVRFTEDRRNAELELARHHRAADLFRKLCADQGRPAPPPAERAIVATQEIDRDEYERLADLMGIAGFLDLGKQPGRQQRLAS